MATTLNGSGITFGDGSSLTTAIPAVEGVGSIKSAIYNAASPYPATQAQTDIWYAKTDYALGTTSSGGSLTVDYSQNNSGASINTSTSSIPGYVGEVSSAARINITGRTGLSYFSSGSAGNIELTANKPVNLYNGSVTYRTLSGSWRSLSPFSIGTNYWGYGNISSAYWVACLWQRYA